MSVAQAAALLGVHPNTVRAWTEAGRLPAYRINARGDRRFRRSDVQRLLLEGDGTFPRPDAARPVRLPDVSIGVLDRLSQAGGASTPAAVSRLAVEILRSELKIGRVAVYLTRGEELLLESHGGHPTAPPLRLDTDTDVVPAGAVRMSLVAGSIHVGSLLLEDLPPDVPETFLHAVAGAIAAAVSTARSLSRLRRELRRARALRGVITELSGQLDLNAVLQEVVQRTRVLFAADRAGLWLVGEGRHPFEVAAQYGLSDAFRQRAADLTMESETLGVRAVRERRAIAYGRLERRAGALDGAYAAEGIHAACLVPLVVDERAVGLLGLYHDSYHPWPEDELALAQAFANQAAIAISNARLYDSAARQAARMRSIQDLSARLNRLTEVRAIGEAIVDEASTLAEYHDIRVYRVDHAARQCEPIAFTKAMLGERGDYVERLRVKVGEGFTGWVAEHGEPLLIDNALEDPRGKTIDDTPEIEESMLVVPMVFESSVLGVIVLSQLGFGRFTADDLQTMMIFGGYAAQALSNATAYERLNDQSRELARQLNSQRQLLKINERLLSTLDPTAVLDIIASGLRAVVNYDNLAISQVDTEARVLRPIFARDRHADEVMAHVIPFGRGLSGWAVDHAEPVLANDALRDPRALQIPGTPPEPEALIIVPLIADGEVIGAMNIGRMGGEEVHFSAGDFELVKLFAGQAAIALRNAGEHQAVAQRADTDALTGMGNHGAFQRTLAAAIETAQARGDQVGLLMMDLDRFKAYNDALGHPAGDRLLHAAATAIYGAARSDDRVFRYGGDEFALVLPATGAAGAERVAERVRRAVASVTAGSEHTVSITVGVAAFPNDAADKNGLISAADTALYFGKQAGENRVVRADVLPPEVRTLRGRLDQRARAALREAASGGRVDQLIEEAVGAPGADGTHRTLVELARVLAARDRRSHGHGDRVGHLARRIALELGCHEAAATAIELGARLHDLESDDPLSRMPFVGEVVEWGHGGDGPPAPLVAGTLADQIIAAAHAYDVRTAEGGPHGGRREALGAIRARGDVPAAVIAALERVVGAAPPPTKRRRAVDEVPGAA